MLFHKCVELFLLFHLLGWVLPVRFLFESDTFISFFCILVSNTVSIWADLCCPAYSMIVQYVWVNVFGLYFCAFPSKPWHSCQTREVPSACMSNLLDFFELSALLLA